MERVKTDILVIGAGPAGSIAAGIVAKKGYSVQVVDREKFPRFVIGESLLPRSMEAFEEAGFLDVLKAQKYQDKFGAKFLRGDKVCDFNFSSQHTKGWTWTWQVPRADFDLCLATELQNKGVPVHFETTVTAIEFNGSDSVTTVVDKAGKQRQIEAKFIIDASGYGRVIPRLFNLDRPSDLPPRKTLFTHIKDVDRNQYEEPNRITIVVHRPEVWIWVIPFSNGNTSVGFVGAKEFHDEFKGSPEEQLRAMINAEPHIKKRFGDKNFEWEPRTIEGWSVTTDKFFGDGFVLTGNVTEFLDPVFSSGVTLAVSSSQLAANLVLRKLQGEKIDWQKDYQDKMMYGVNTFRSYVMGWYDQTLQDIFFAKSINEDFKNQICSVLAGYVWDETNPFVKKHDKILKTLSEVIRITEGQEA